MRAYQGELRKLASLRSVWASIAIGVLVPAALTFLNAKSAAARGGNVDVGFQELAFGVVGAVILGVVAVSSEYTVEGESAGGGRQITTSLTVVPSRRRLLIAKLAAVITAVAVLAAVSSAVTLMTVDALLGTSDFARLPGVVLYWVLTALLASGLTLVTRNGILPLVVLILNSSVVTVTYLLSKLTPLAVFFPDLAGVRMFVRRVDLPVQLAPVTGGLVMAAWVAALLAVGFLVFRRRDA
ncbi:ABC transporter integral membrane protein [Amycolatopsis azurea]|uniref:ABC transporter integral membrane protein n=1 Tax=Amycolatopsis azurea DSM 43854 TaxID=1238180 RepID=M2PX25_9PSEU|nr:ABC transporter integral membrane protein [Amycolatopsis azurea]EMD24170.1 ABC transporter integral membrane protein [Amycolatopsis azurea DSM 43854]OOC08000.1 ABC transporter permease [Amycolatopsis azurea DSM 43854]